MCLFGFRRICEDVEEFLKRIKEEGLTYKRKNRMQKILKRKKKKKNAMVKK